LGLLLLGFLLSTKAVPTILAVGVLGDIWSIPITAMQPDWPLDATQIYGRPEHDRILFNSITGAVLGNTFYLVGQARGDGDYQQSLLTLDLGTNTGNITPLYLPGESNATIMHLFACKKENKLFYLASEPMGYVVTMGELVGNALPETLFSFPLQYRSIDAPSFDSASSILYFATYPDRSDRLIAIVNVTAAMLRAPPHQILKEDIPFTGVEILRRTVVEKGKLVTCLAPDNVPSVPYGLAVVEVANDGVAPVKDYVEFGKLNPSPCSRGVNYFATVDEYNSLLLPACCPFGECEKTEQWYFYNSLQGVVSLLISIPEQKSSPLCERVFAVY